MSNKYLEKIAKEKEKSNVGAGKTTLAYLGGGTLGGLAARPIQMSTGHSLMGAHANKITSRQIGDGTTEKGFIKKYKLDLDISKDHDHPLGPHFTYGSKKNVVMGSPNHGIQMHELGHALDLRKGSLIKHYATGGAAAIGGLGLSLKGIHDNNTAETIGGTYLASSPILKREAMANIHAYKAFREFEGKAVANKFLKHIALKNTINYHAPVAMVAAGLVGATKFIHRHDKDV